jgi:uncharacterized protein YjbI with pentapeptide repeats
MPIVQLVQSSLLGRDADHAQVAEMMLSGFVRRLTPIDTLVPPEQVQFDFAPEVRPLLLESLRRDDARKLATLLQSYIERRFGTGRDQTVLLDDPRGSKLIPAGARPFAELSERFIGWLHESSPRVKSSLANGLKIANAEIVPDIRSSKATREIESAAEELLATEEDSDRAMANSEHLELLRQGVDVWNAWRDQKRSILPDLRGANLGGVNLGGANLGGAILSGANLGGANLDTAILTESNLRGANLSRANLMRADLTLANLGGTILSGANLSEANLSWADLIGADLTAANLGRANLGGAILSGANLDGANLGRANLGRAQLVETNLVDAALTDCRVYGVSAWGVKLNEGTKQQGLIITPENEPSVTVDDLEVAQFVYLLLHNEKIRSVIDTIGRKGVLLLGRFTEGRIAVLERLQDELRKRGYLPIVFNFDKPETKDFTETIRLLAGLSKLVIADIANPKSSPLELYASVPEIMVPFQPIIEEGEKPFAMLQDLWIKHRDWVFEPIYYSSLDALVAALDEKIIMPAEARFDQLVMRRATMTVRRL